MRVLLSMLVAWVVARWPIALDREWRRFAVRRVLGLRAPAFCCYASPERSGGPPTPWASIAHPMAFGGVTHDETTGGDGCREPVVVLRMQPASLDAYRNGSAGGTRHAAVVDPPAQAGRRIVARAPGALRRRGWTSPTTAALVLRACVTESSASG